MGYAKVDEVKKFVKSEKLVTMMDDDIQKVIDFCSDLIDRYCRTKFTSNQKTFKADGGVEKVPFPVLPLISVTEVIEDGMAITENTDFYVYDSYILKEEGFSEGRKNIEISYNYGYEQVPGVVVKVCLDLVRSFLVDDGYESEKHKDYSYNLHKKKNILAQLNSFRAKRQYRIGVI